MPTAHPEIFAALCAPFSATEVRSRQGSGGKSLHYITGRTAQNRFDSVLGPENWRDTYTDTPEGLRCRIEIRLTPESEWLWKEDGGAGADMPEADNEEKSAYSDAFKRAAVKWGIARYLYRDGVPNYDPTLTRTDLTVDSPEVAERRRELSTADTVRTPGPAPARPAPATNGQAAFEPDGSIRKPNSGKGMFACCKEQQDKHQAKFIESLNGWAKQNGMAGRMVDWTEDEVDKGWRHLCYLVAKHTGTLGSEPAPATRVQPGGDVSGLRSAIIARAGEILQVGKGAPPVDTEIGAKLKGHWRELFAGAEMPRFGTITNSEQLNTLLETLEMEFKEVTDSVPF